MRSRRERKIRNLQEHADPYVSPSELATYWSVSRKQIYKQIEAGTLKALRLGPRLLRIRTTEAVEFERSARMLVDDIPSSTHRRAEAPERPSKQRKRK
jgi:excisionase family DNA binding protein